MSISQVENFFGLKPFFSGAFNIPWLKPGVSQNPLFKFYQPITNPSLQAGENHHIHNPGL
jgi:hypothetical protein